MRSVPRPSPTIRALLFLAAADILVIIQFGVMTVSTPLLGLLKGPHRMTQLYLMLYGMPLGQIVNLISVFITVIVTWQRYISVCVPHKASSLSSSCRVNIQVLVITIVSTLFHLPMFFQEEMVRTESDMNLIKRPFAQTTSYSIFYSIVLVHIIRYFLPITLLVYMAHGLLRELGKRKHQDRLVDTSRQRAKLELTLSLIIVIIVFIVCQSFAPVRQILRLLFRPYSAHIQCGGSLFYFGPLDMISILVNSSANFIIFVVCARGFRNRLLLLFNKQKTANHSQIVDVDPDNNPAVQQDQQLEPLAPNGIQESSRPL